MSATAIPEQSSAEAWRRVGRSAGYVAGIGLFIGTLLFLLDALNALGASPDYHATAAGPMQDEANFWVAYFAHQHHILWDIIARDSLFPLAFVALIVLSLAVGNLVAYDRPDAQLMVTFFVVGGILSALSDLIYLAGTDYWRVTGWSTEPPAGWSRSEDPPVRWGLSLAGPKQQVSSSSRPAWYAWDGLP